MAVGQLTFRRAIGTDAPAIVSLIESAYRGPSSRDGWTTEADLLDGQRTDLLAVQHALQRENCLLLVALTASGAIVGCAQIEGRDPGRAYFGSFAVRPGLQGAGLGRQLLAEAERCAQVSFEADVMEMTVIAQRSDLIAWYERRGYGLTGEARPFPYDDERAGIPRRPDLHFVVLEKRLDKNPPSGPPRAKKFPGRCQPR